MTEEEFEDRRHLVLFGTDNVRTHGFLLSLAIWLQVIP